MQRRLRGFTLIELMIVIAIIAIIAAIAIPNLLSARLNANETSAVATLRTVATAQAQFQSSCACDVDRDGTGEYGLFRELSGAATIRTAADGSSTGGKLLNPPILPGRFRVLAGTLQVFAQSSGYRFDMVLPGAGGTALHERATTFGANTDTELCETTWSCYAAPLNHGSSGVRTFFTNQQGHVTWKDDPNLNIGAGQAFRAGGSLATITGIAAVGATGRDGRFWSQVN